MIDSSLEKAIVDSIAGSDLAALAADLAECGLDAVLDSGLARDIPVIGTLVKTYNVAATIQNRIFAAKLLRFLSGLADVPKEQRTRQLAKLTVDTEERQKVGENLIVLLDRLNDLAKPTMMATAFKALLEGRIDLQQFQDLAFVIDYINMAAIPTLRRCYKHHRYQEILEPDGHVQHLAMCGLFSIKFRKIDTTARFGNGGSAHQGEKPAGALTCNALGKLFCDIVLNKMEKAT